MSLRRWLEKLCRFCFQTWHFCEEGVYKVYDKKDGTPFMVFSPDGSLRRSADGLIDIHTNTPLSLEIKWLFHLHKGSQCILRFQSGISHSVRYMERMVLQSEGHLLFCWSPKNGNVKCYDYHNICNAFKCLIISLTLTLIMALLLLLITTYVQLSGWKYTPALLTNQNHCYNVHANIKCLFYTWWWYTK